MKLLDGKATAQHLKEEVKAHVSEMKQRGERVPHLAAVLVGNDGASLTYVGSKVRSCEYVGFESTLIQLPEDTTEAALLEQVDALNEIQQLTAILYSCLCLSTLMKRYYWQWHRTRM